jgi:hypothetical protein
MPVKKPAPKRKAPKRPRMMRATAVAKRQPRPETTRKQLYKTASTMKKKMCPPISRMNATQLRSFINHKHM